MTFQQGRRAPYASTGSVQTVIEKHRQVGLPTMSLQRLQQIGVSEALAPRTLHALVFLGFYDENGNVTPEFDALRKVPEHDFRPRLAALLRNAYADVLEILDPATAMPLDVENAFRGFEPTGQLPRMVQLFMGLMIYAGVMPEGRRRQPPASTGSRADVSKQAAVKTASGNSSASTSGLAAGQERKQQTPPKPAAAEGTAYERRDVTLGAAGSVSIIVNVRWLDLSDDQFTKLRKLIKDIEALGDPGPPRDFAPAAGTAGASKAGENGTSSQADVLTGAGLPHGQ
jgi:hypothetical protein